MIKNLIWMLPVMTVLIGCSPSNYTDQAVIDSQRTYQSSYATYDSCYRAFPFDGDCYRGVNGLWYSPPYYPWGAVIHHNHLVTYNHVVPVGGLWIHTSYHPSVNYSYAKSYVSSREHFYYSKNNSTYNSNVTKTSYNYSKPNTDSKISSINFGAKPTVLQNKASTAKPFGTNFKTTSNSSSKVSRINFGSSSSSRSSSRSSSSSSRRH